MSCTRPRGAHPSGARSPHRISPALRARRGCTEPGTEPGAGPSADNPSAGPSSACRTRSRFGPSPPPCVPGGRAGRPIAAAASRRFGAVAYGRVRPAPFAVAEPAGPPGTGGVIYAARAAFGRAPQPAACGLGICPRCGPHVPARMALPPRHGRPRPPTRPSAGRPPAHLPQDPRGAPGKALPALGLQFPRRGGPGAGRGSRPPGPADGRRTIPNLCCSFRNKGQTPAGGSARRGARPPREPYIPCAYARSHLARALSGFGMSDMSV